MSESTPLHAPLEAPAYAEPAPSVLHQLNLCNRQLERLLHNLRNEHHAERDIRDIARDLIRAVDINTDVALACIFLSQINGSYAVRHCIETAVVTVVIARSMGMDPAHVLAVTAAALTMNVGMLRHHDSLQNQHALTHEEVAIIRRHPEESVDMLRCVGVDDENWISCVLMHHENDEGSGYPAGIASPEVTLIAKLLSFADRYCAQVSARNYRKSQLPGTALQNLMQDRTAPVDPQVAACVARELGNFPPGSLVRLNSGDVGVVSRRQGGAGGMQVHCLRDAAGMLLSPAQARYLPEGAAAISAGLSEDQASTRFSMKQIWGVQAAL